LIEVQVVGRVSAMPARRAVLVTVVALVVVGCVDRKSDRREAVTPATVYVAPEEPAERAGSSDTVIGTVVERATGTKVTRVDSPPPVSRPEPKPGRKATPPPPNISAPPTTVDEYNPELVDWCADLNRRVGDLRNLTGFTVESVPVALEQFRAIRATAPPEIHASLDDWISVLELLKQAVEKGEVTDSKDAIARWALTTLGQERVASLRVSSETIVTFVSRSCLGT
jgi:hypothetical protein